MAKATIGLAVGTAVLALGTIALAIFSLIQIFDFRDQERRQLRAYVFVTKSEIRDFGGDKHITAMLDLKNFGSTPAYQLQRRAAIGFGAYPRIGELPALRPLGGYKSDIGPGDDVFLGPLKAEHVLTPDEIAEIVAGRGAVYVWGAVRYLDAFEKLQCTRFRLLFRGDGTALAPNTILALEHADEGNDADKNCETIRVE